MKCQLTTGLHCVFHLIFSLSTWIFRYPFASHCAYAKRSHVSQSHILPTQNHKKHIKGRYPFADAIPNGVSATSSAGSSAAPTGTGGGFSDSYGYGSSYAYNQQLPASNNAGFPQQQQQQFASNFPAFPFPQLPTVNFAPFGGNLPLPPLLTPDQFSEALSQYVTSVQQQYAKWVAANIRQRQSRLAYSEDDRDVHASVLSHI